MNKLFLFLHGTLHLVYILFDLDSRSKVPKNYMDLRWRKISVDLVEDIYSINSYQFKTFKILCSREIFPCSMFYQIALCRYWLMLCLHAYWRHCYFPCNTCNRCSEKLATCAVLIHIYIFIFLITEYNLIY